MHRREGADHAERGTLATIKDEIKKLSPFVG
jgi:hypothetical protein